jgi:serine/threonine protein phosphatase 1
MRSPLSLAGWPSRRAARPAPRAPEGVTLYAIGDIHGRADLLEPLIAAVLHDASGRPGPVVVALGDYVDRGPDSRRVVDLMLGLQHAAGIAVRLLRGNHDQSLLDFLDDPETGPRWMELGGRDTLLSYGVEPPATRKDMGLWREARARFGTALPDPHLEFFQRLELTFAAGDYFFAHAGVRPSSALEAQSQRDLLWIRQPFLADRQWLGKMVVHGHTPAEEVHADHRRIGLDTGAYDSGVLSACRLEGESRLLFQAVETGDARPTIRSRPF